MVVSSAVLSDNIEGADHITIALETMIPTAVLLLAIVPYRNE